MTGISKAVLAADNNCGVQGHTFWEVMSWASKRQTTRMEDKAYSLIGLFDVSLAITYGEGQQAFPCLLEAISAKDPSWDIFAWSGQPSVYHFALPSSPASYSRFETCAGEDRVRVQNFTITTYRLSLRSLPVILVEPCSVIVPERAGKPFLVNLKPRYRTLQRFSNLVVECGATCLKTIHGVRQLSACIINHHAMGSREQGKLMFGREYICFLLYSEEEDRVNETVWTKLVTDNLLWISCLGIPEMVTGNSMTCPSDGFTLSLVTTFIRSPKL